jgi:hypothetical protein
VPSMKHRGRPGHCDRFAQRLHRTRRDSDASGLCLLLREHRVKGPRTRRAAIQELYDCVLRQYRDFRLRRIARHFLALRGRLCCCRSLASSSFFGSVNNRPNSAMVKSSRSPASALVSVPLCAPSLPLSLMTMDKSCSSAGTFPFAKSQGRRSPRSRRIFALGPPAMLSFGRCRLSPILACTVGRYECGHMVDTGVTTRSVIKQKASTSECHFLACLLDFSSRFGR